MERTTHRDFVKVCGDLAPRSTLKKTVWLSSIPTQGPAVQVSRRPCGRSLNPSRPFSHAQKFFSVRAPRGQLRSSSAAPSHFNAVYRDEHLVVEVTRQREIESAWLAGLLCGLGGRPRIGCSLLSGGPCISRSLLSRFEHLLNLCRSVFAPFLRRRLELR